MLAKVELSFFDVKFAKKEMWSKKFYHPRQWDGKKAYKKYVKNNYDKYFDKLEENYNDTKYYKEILQKCGNLKYYKKLKGE